MTRIRQKSSLVTVNFPNVNFLAFTPVTTLGNTVFNFQKPKKLRRIYPIACNEALVNIFGRIGFLDITGNPLQVVPVTSLSGTAAAPVVRIDSRVGFNEFINLEIGGFVVLDVSIEVAAVVTFGLTFEFEEEYLDDSF